MENTKNEIIEKEPENGSEAEASNRPNEEYDPDDWDDITWDDLDESVNEDESEDESDDEPENESDDKSDEQNQDENKYEDTDQWLELKHMDDPVRKVSKSEAKQLALKGLDYDRIREDRDNLRNDVPRYREMEKFLNELKGDFATVEDLMDDTRARVLMQDNDALSYEEAVKKAKANRSSPQKQPEAKPNPVDDFVKKFPKVKAEEIPESVWAEVRETGDLAGAYSNYLANKKDDEIKQLRDEIEILKKNNKNSARATGSRKTSGNSKNAAFDDMWYDGT